MSLIELLVSVTILAIAMTVALSVYDMAQKSYRSGENRVEQQQVARVAFDLMSNEIRLAGLNLYPDGDHGRPDEAIEAAFERAIVLRADFDRDEGAPAQDPEDSLAGGKFVTVSTGNDEIHAFVLAKSDTDGTASGPDSITFEADVSEAMRDGDVETVTIDDIVLDGTDPPYTLYRVSFSNDPTKYGTPGFAHKTVLADNIQNLRFHYFDLAGSEITAPGGAEDPASVAARASIHRVTVEFETRTARPDPTTMAYRSLEFAANVTPRNRGRIRIPDTDGALTRPRAPGLPVVLAGHCGGLLVEWPPNPAYDEVSYYRVLYGEQPETDQVAATTQTEHYVDLLADATAYTVRIEAVNYAGMPGPTSGPVTVTTRNDNTPSRPEGLASSVSFEGSLQLGWDAVTSNTQSIPDTQLRDLAGYRVYRGTSADFVPAEGNRVADETEVSAVDSPVFTDRRTVSCRDYYYAATAVDRCGEESEFSTVVSGRVETTEAPLAPDSVHAFEQNGQLVLTWQPVRDEAGTWRPIWIDRYKVYRSGPTDPDAPPDDASGFNWVGTVDAQTQFLDFMLADGRIFWYAVQAVDDCGNESALSEIAGATCSFQGQVVFDRPDYGAQASSSVDFDVRVEDPIGSYEGLELSFVNEDDGSSYQASVSGSGPGWSYRMQRPPSGSFTPGWYTVRARVTQWDGSASCPRTATVRVRLGDE